MDVFAGMAMDRTKKRQLVLQLVQAEQYVDSIINDQIARGVRDEKTFGALSNSDSAIENQEAVRVQLLLKEQRKLCTEIIPEIDREMQEEEALRQFSQDRRVKKIKGGNRVHGGYGLGR